MLLLKERHPCNGWRWPESYAQMYQVISSGLPTIGVFVTALLWLHFRIRKKERPVSAPRTVVTWLTAQRWRWIWVMLRPDGSRGQAPGRAPRPGGWICGLGDAGSAASALRRAACPATLILMPLAPTWIILSQAGSSLFSCREPLDSGRLVPSAPSEIAKTCKGWAQTLLHIEF